MSKGKNYSALKDFCLDMGVDLFGVADISGVKQDFALSKRSLAGLDRAVSLGARLSSAILSEIENAPTRLYFHHYRTVNAFLDQAALRTCNYIQGRGYCALPVPASQILDWQNQKGHLSHKRIGYLAGLGWIGRNNLLVNSSFGSQLRLVSILTDMPLEADAPLRKDCGKCVLCVKICPAGAIKKDSASFDHLLCFEKLKGFQKQRLTDQYICGVCVNVCRGNKKTG